MTQAEEILRSINKAESKKGQGRLKIFMGMVAGVGKTYAMLKAAHALQETGEDPLLGYVETHGRKETVSLLDGLTILPRKKIPYKDVILEEFDIDGLLEIRPKLVLIDELAHTNVSGSRHQKRWQDVLEIIGQGIDVWTTLNVQHVESRAETISGITGVRIHELVPDSVIDRADEIVLIDLIPDEIVARLKKGKIYAPEKVDSATTNFFKVSNLTALREVALRLMAERVDHELKDLSVIQGVPLPVKTHHKIMVAIFGSPYSESLVRYTRKLAYGLNCQWYAGFVNTDRSMTEKEKELIDRNIELVKQLGGEVVSTQNESVAEGLLDLARQFGASQIIVGKSSRRNIWHRLTSKPLPHQLIEIADGIDINVISPVRRVPIDKSKTVKPKRDFEFDWRKILTTTGYVANLTILNAILVTHIHYRAIGIIYLMGITIGALIIKSYNVVLAAILGGICWNVFFLPPKFTFVIENHEDWLLVTLYLVAGLVIGSFTDKLKVKENILKSEGERATILYSITKELSEAQDVDSLVLAVQAQVDRIFGTKVTVFLKPDDSKDFDPKIEEGKGNFEIPPKEEYALQWVIKNRLPAGRFTDTLPMSEGYYIPLLEGKQVIGIIAMNASDFTLFGHDKKLILDAIARQVSTAMQRERLEGQLREQLLTEESERIYKTLLNSVSHEMRTPLAAIKGFASALNQDEIIMDREQVKSLAGEVKTGVERLDYVVQNLLDMSRLESGNLKLNFDYTDILELVEEAVKKVKRFYGDREVRIYAEKNLPFIFLDHFLVEQTVENIIRNAYLYTPEGSPIDIDIKVGEKEVEVIITDYGLGISSLAQDQIFQKFYREHPEKTGGLGLGLSISRAIIELHRGSLNVTNVKGKGASFIIRLPRELDREFIIHE